MVKSFNKKSTLKKSITKSTSQSKKYTLKKSASKPLRNKENEENKVTKVFLELLLMIKFFHWRTTSYAIHKATDELYSSLNENIDKFIEVLLGKNESRIDFTNIKTISIIYLHCPIKLKLKIECFKDYLDKLTNNKVMNSSDLLNIRDEILADLNQFLYLLTLE